MDPDDAITCEIESRRRTLEAQGLGAFADLVIETEQLAGLGRLSAPEAAAPPSAEADPWAAVPMAPTDALAPPNPHCSAPAPARPAAASAPFLAPAPAELAAAPPAAPLEETPAPSPPEAPRLDLAAYLERLGASEAERAALARIWASAGPEAAAPREASIDRAAFVERLAALDIDGVGLAGAADETARRASRDADALIERQETASDWLAAALNGQPELDAMRAGAVFAACDGGRSALVLDAAQTDRFRAEAEAAGLTPAALMRAWLAAES